MIGTDPMSADPQTALENEYVAEWKVRQPARFCGEHRPLDVTLISDTASGLAEKLRAFTELIRDLP
jgi:hypothetical protein